jgi:hypothetical protein
MHPRTRIPAAVDHPLHDLDRRLDTWTKEHLISRDEAGAIWAFEAYRLGRPDTRKVRTTPLTEALAYLGVALAVAALGVILGRVWQDLPTAAQIAIPGLVALALLVVGWATRRSSDPAVARVSHVAWFASAGAVAWFVAELTVEAFGATHRWPVLWTGVATAGYAAALYVARPAALQHVALLVGLALVAGGALFDSPLAVWSVIWVLGLLWIVLGWRGLLAGRTTAYTVGTIVALASAVAVPGSAGRGLMWLAVVNAAALIAAAVALRQTPMLVLASIGLFQATVGAIGRYLGGGLGAAVGLLVAGVAVLLVALLVSRRRPARPTTS